jgi:hypothetical protein
MYRNGAPNVFLREREERMAQDALRVLIKPADLPPRGLNALRPKCSSPNSAIKSHAMTVDVLPRVSFGNHHPYAVDRRRWAMTMDTGRSVPERRKTLNRKRQWMRRESTRIDAPPHPHYV